MIQENCLVAVDTHEVTFFDEKGKATFLAETEEDAIGTWTLKEDKKLDIRIDKNGDLKATYQLVPIDVQEFENGLPGEIISGPSAWVHS